MELRLESLRMLLSMLREGEAIGPDAEDGTPAAPYPSPLTPHPSPLTPDP